jgi:predicted transcriptional regulator
MSNLGSDTVIQYDEKERVAFEAAVREGLADSAAGRVTPYEKVRRWLLSWGSESELPPPQ